LENSSPSDIEREEILVDGSGAITPLLACTDGNKEEEQEEGKVVVGMRSTGFDIDLCWTLGAGASRGGIFCISSAKWLVVHEDFNHVLTVL